jgi:hypothetical protein
VAGPPGAGHGASVATPPTTRYASVAILLAPMSEHGDTCVVSQHAGPDLIVCKGGTVAQTFSSAQNTPPGIVTLAHAVLRHDKAAGKTEAPAAGPDWRGALPGIPGPPRALRQAEAGYHGSRGDSP